MDSLSSERIKREYPPTIPLLAQTGNLRGRMPWILTKHYDHSNGRLVLKGEKVKHHEYFEVHREDGRLILNLVPLDNALACFDSALNIHEHPQSCLGHPASAPLRPMTPLM
ncbi:hypothetical protein CerSpe_054950 [Prunus speciosa]